MIDEYSKGETDSKTNSRISSKGGLGLYIETSLK